MTGERLVSTGMAALLGLAGLVLACEPLRSAPQLDEPVAAAREPAAAAAEDSGDTERFTVRLSEAAAEGKAVEPSAPVPAVVLSADDAQRVLARLPALSAAPGDAVEFAWRESSQPPPRTGRDVKTAFPPAPQADGPPDLAAGPLEVLRRAPDGDVPLAPNLSVTFSQPMIAVAAQGELERGALPVRLEPEPNGQWRWIGTRTLLFEPDPRFPMATEYRVEIPAGTRSARGGALAEAVRWTFRTPPPNAVQWHPAQDAVTGLEPLLFVAFDQGVDARAVLPHLRLRAGNASAALRLASAAEVKADPTVRDLAVAAGEGRWVAFRAVGPLPRDVAVAVSVESGTPSAEGPRGTLAARGWSFETFGPLRVVDLRCGDYGSSRDDCPPYAPLQIWMSNPLDPERFRPEWVRVEPPVPGLRVHATSDDIWLEGRTRPRTHYRIRLAPELADVFGQTLGPVDAVGFTVSAAQPFLTGPTRSHLVVLDPDRAPHFPVYTVNQSSLKLRVYAVQPEDWTAYSKLLEQRFPEPPGRQLDARTLPIAGNLDDLTETVIDLQPYLSQGPGQLLLIVEPEIALHNDWRDNLVAWVQVTRIGLSAYSDATHVLAWATDLGDGRPLQDVSFELLGSGSTARSGPDGLATLDLGARAAALLVARRGADVALLPYGSYYGDGWVRSSAKDALRFSVFDDQGIYRPGESVRIKGWLRRIAAGPAGDVQALGTAARRVQWQLRDSEHNELAKGERELNAFGAFDLEFSLPPTVNLGRTCVYLEADGSLDQHAYNHCFEVQEFRRPEFEVSAKASDGPHFLGGQASVAVSASYYAGGGLGGAPVRWEVTTRAARFTPPNHGDFSFGRWLPWWLSFEDAAADDEKEAVQAFDGRTGPEGRHVLRLDFDRSNPPSPMSVIAKATVIDVNRQAWTAAEALLVHPAALYVGLRSSRPFYARGEPISVDTIAVDLEGKAVTERPLALRAERLEWARRDGKWREQVAGRQDCSVRSAREAVRCTFAAQEGGVYRILAEVSDDQQRRSRSELRLWVVGGQPLRSGKLDSLAVTLVPDKKEYRAGDTAELLVLAPFFPAEGVLTLRRSGLLRSERFSMTEASHTLRVPIEEGFTPNVQVQVDLVGRAEPPAAGAESPVGQRPAFASGQLRLSVPPYSRTLRVAVAPREQELEPGSATQIDVELRDARGQPVSGGEVALAVIDEAVLALSDYALPDPLADFYAERPAGVADRQLRANVLLQAEPPTAGGLMSASVRGVVPESVVARGSRLERARSAPMLMQRGQAESPAMRLRSDFSSRALFVPSLRTDASGRARAELELPDNLTRYRVMAVAAAQGNQFGRAEASLTARRALMVRPSPPRFLNFGDRFELPVVVQNQTDAPLSADVAVRAENAELTAGAGRRVVVPARDRVELRFPAAAQRAGQARFQVGAAAGRLTDAAEVALPVWTPATSEAFATYGQIDAGAIAQPVAAPRDAVPDFGGLELTTSSTALQALTDAVLYLHAYPFGCSEQLASRVLAVAALRDVLGAFQAEGLPAPEELEAAVARDIAKLATVQNPDGGFPFWRQGEEAWPYVSVHVAHALERAAAKGFAVPKSMLARSRVYLESIDAHIPAHYSAESRRALRAYALYVRFRLGQPDAARARSVLGEAGVGGLSFEALGWLLPVLAQDPGANQEADEIRQRLANGVTETAASAHFAVRYTDGAEVLLHSDRRADAVVLEALIGDQPGSDLIPKLAEGLLSERRAGRWSSTQENAFVLLALDRYFQTYEKTTPDFVARVWLGERYAAEQRFRGRSTDRSHLDLPLRTLREQQSGDLVVSKDGPGRLYYRIGLRYAPTSLVLAPADRGFTVDRRYEALDAPGDVRRDADGAWHVRAGARVRVVVTLVAPAQRSHVALVDPLPAGLEAVNPALAVSGGDEPAEVTPFGPVRGFSRDDAFMWRGTWFEHQNLRDERVEAFATVLPEGVYRYAYVARATTPGLFVVPPPRAEEMYAPETFGRGGTDHVVVE